MSNTIGTSCTSKAGTGAVTTTWWRAPPAGIRPPAAAPTSASFGPPVSTTCSVSIGPSDGVDADDASARGAQAGERAALADVDADAR